MSSADSGSSRNNKHRDNNGVFSEKYGFSVVAPISVTVPCSTAGSRTSCWALDHRCTSSTNRTVLNRPPSAPAMTLRASATPDDTADSETISAPTASASRYASVVLPVPAGPHRISDGSALRSSSFWSARPAPIRWRCPTNSAGVRGRIRAASGWSLTAAGYSP